MSGSTITTTVTIGVTLGTLTAAGTYASPLTVTTAGTIAPSAYGVTALYAAVNAGYSLNQGVITGGAGQIGNLNTMGGFGGIGVDLLTGTLTNDGTVRGGVGGGALGYRNFPNVGGVGGFGAMLAGGSLINHGTIAGGDGGAAYNQGGRGNTGVLIAGGTLLNAGVIAGGKGIQGTGEGSGGGGGLGVELVGGNLTNNGTVIGGIGGNGGTFGGVYGSGGVGQVGVYLLSGVLTNNGTILGAAGGRDGGGLSGPLPGSGASGAGVIVQSGGTLIDLGFIGGGGSADAVDFVGTSARLVFEPGASFGGLVQGSGNLLELAATSSTGTITGLGTSLINFGSINFDPGAHWMIVGNTAGLAGTIGGFAYGDTIELNGVTATGSSYSGGILTLNEASGSATLAFSDSFATGSFVVQSVAGGIDITLVPCFRAGTRIATPDGDVPVERLAAGDQVVTIDGTTSPIIWIGHRTIDCRRHPTPDHLWPVRVQAGAFGDGLPRRPLFLSPDHAVFVDGILIPIKHLINGISIAQVPMDEVTYYHVELSSHSVLLAEGLPAESYLDTGDRSTFANGEGPVRLHPAFTTMTWEALGFAPLVVTGPRLDVVRERVDALAGVGRAEARSTAFSSMRAA